MTWLQANRMMVISDYHNAFVAEFGRADVSAANLHALRKRKGWKTGRDGDRYKGRHTKYTPEHLTWFRENATLSLADAFAEFCAAFPGVDITAEKIHALRKRYKLKTVRTGCFVKGQEPPNKGKVCPPGVGGRHPNARKTQFKKNELPHNARGAGHERIDEKDGYVILIIAEKNPWTGADTRPVHKHRWLWEQKNGPVPEGFVLKCLDSNKLNTDPSNWEAVPRAVLARLNGGRRRARISYDAAPASLKPTVMALAKLEDRMRVSRDKN